MCGFKFEYHECNDSLTSGKGGILINNRIENANIIRGKYHRINIVIIISIPIIYFFGLYFSYQAWLDNDLKPIFIYFLGIFFSSFLIFGYQKRFIVHHEKILTHPFIIKFDRRQWIEFSDIMTIKKVFSSEERLFWFDMTLLINKEHIIIPSSWTGNDAFFQLETLLNNKGYSIDSIPFDQYVATTEICHPPEKKFEGEKT